ncbi:riboflavin kinase/FMN adenylyltransferase [Kineosphaera limosa]|uniref:Riboflavin biosynthesis protein n=1 Tax=Kineosphaera limosa NBRC 100340 TaxID=1184609 RepID=K6XDX5_9MICO|nr:bifunctional riboflavin kinase/FAD synthetase [Kineosphaera limosa]NYD99311.1 riboflavin kinase/FMN adenylyltransferase [Kineosphaera limosa]GAB97039.1 riboflavin kinase/FMN adenylyltransferase [Kineosphaera limosa NBRC 100340]
MQRWNDVSQIPSDIGGSVVTLGNFDGVHRGHRAVLTEVLAQAVDGLTSVAVTFDPHPVAVLYPERAPGLITSLDHRLALLEAAGVDAVLVLEFTREFAQLTPDEFVEQVFVDALSARVVVVGEDTRFGVRNSGDVATLLELGERFGFEVVTVRDQGADGEHSRWSSTQVRELLSDGDVGGAARVLGRPHRVSGVVVHGDHRGRELGYPTANLERHCDGLVPADGVYAGWLVRPQRPASDPDSTLPAAISIGTNPTFEGTSRRVEAYVLDRTDLDLYGEPVTLEFVARLRPTLRFDSVDELLDRMAEDVTKSREILSTMVPVQPA